MKLLIILLILVTYTNAHAFRINPSNRSETNSADNKHILDKISEPVHEVLTRKTRDAYISMCKDDNDSNRVCPDKNYVPSTINDSLVRGVWWSDDPNQNLYKARQALWLGNMLDAERRAKNSKYVIDGKYKMHYRSHYGDLQFLHAMAYKDGVKAQDTKDKIIMWVEFLYQISTGKINSNTKFKNVDVNGLSSYFKRQKNWKLKYIFQPRYLLSRTDDFKDHALGIILHLIQDSYSKAHVDRVYKNTDSCKNGYINSFLSYTNQKPSKHGTTDTWKGYESSSFTENNNPITVGAQIMFFVKNNSDWKAEVEPYLNNSVFCLSDNPDKSGSGGY